MRSTTRKLSHLITLLLAGLALCSPAWAGGYTITDLGTFGGTTSVAYGINDNGQVVGHAFTAGDTAYHAFLYSNGVKSDLGTFGGTSSIAYDINNNGQVVGAAQAAGNAAQHAFLYSNGAMTDLGTLGGTGSGALRINNNGQMVGWSFTTGNAAQHAFLYSNGAMTDLGTFGGTTSAAYGINDNGQVVGQAYTTDNTAQHAFLYSGGVMSDLDTLGGSNVYDINNNGQMVGWSGTASASHAILYSNGVMSYLGTLGGAHSNALGISNNGQVVGSASIAGNTDHAFLYSDGNLVDINSLLSQGSGWELTEARDINDLGQIVGTGTINGQRHAFLMSPTATVPIPAAAWLLGSGLLGLIGVARRGARLRSDYICWTCTKKNQSSVNRAATKQ